MKSQPFLITGMPRGRQAWLSVLCTTGRSLCYYDPSVRFSQIEDLRSLYDSEFYKFVGVADTAMSFFLPWILENIRPRTLIIDRDPAEVEASHERIGNLSSNAPTLAHAAILPFKEHPLVMWVPFEALSRKRVIQRIFWHLMPGEPFDETRYEELARLHIGIDLKDQVAEVQRRKPQLERLFRDVLPKMERYENAQPS